MPPDQSTNGVQWRKPFFWFLSVLGGALVLALAQLLVGPGSEVLESGDPVSIDAVSTYRSGGTGYSVVFKSADDFTSSDLSALNELRSQSEGGVAEAAWFEGRGGVAIGSLHIQLALSGNRNSVVRVTDIQTVKTCSEPWSGVLMSMPAQGSDRSIRLAINLDEPNPQPTSIELDGESRPYFLGNTISLKDGEQQVVLIEASTKESYCSFNLLISVLDGKETSVQEVTLPGKRPFEVSALLYGREYEAVFIGGLCPQWVKLPPGSEATMELCRE